MQPGEFDTRVTFQEKVKNPNGGGGHDIAWPEVGGEGNGSRWAKMTPVGQSGRDESASESQVAMTLDYWLRVPSDNLTKTIKADWRVLIDGERFNIKSVARPDRIKGTITLVVRQGSGT